MNGEAGFVAPALWAAAIHAARYLLFAALAWLLLFRDGPRALGRALPGRPEAGPWHGVQARRELRQAALTVVVFGAITGLLFGTGLLGQSRLYLRLDAWPWWWLPASVVVLLVLHDMLFYLLHRAMHTRALYGWVHREHHRSVHPTPYAAYRFSSAEAVGESLIVVVLLYVVPVHPLALLAFQTISTAYNVYGHGAREIYPARIGTHPVGRWLNTVTLHAHHHRRGRGNYSLYFTWWDRMLGTFEGPR